MLLPRSKFGTVLVRVSVSLTYKKLKINLNSKFGTESPFLLVPFQSINDFGN
jgi:hypothetical protein